jgi:hypothetical protein
MFVLQVLNDANEWELCVKVFETKFAAVQYFVHEMGGHAVWDSYAVTEMEQHTYKEPTLKELIDADAALLTAEELAAQ